MKKIIFFVFMLCGLLSVCTAQNIFPASGSAGIGTTTPNSAAVLDMQSTTQGMLAPRMTKAQRDGMSSLATGLLIYQTDNTPGFYYFNGSVWTAVSIEYASKNLSNLSASTAINTSLLPKIDSSVNLGSTSFSWKDLYVDGVGYLGSAVKVGGYAGTPQAGMIRWTGTDFEGYNGTAWGTLTSGGSANTGLSNLSTTAINQDMLPASDNTKNLGSASSSWKDAYLDGSLYMGGNRFIAYTAPGSTPITAIGEGALVNNQSAGLYNTAVGQRALYTNTIGIGNTATGNYALSQNTTGIQNTANGYNALYSNTTGGNNTADGAQALYSNTTGSNNIAIGFFALHYNTTGYSNIAIGRSALRLNTTGSNMVALGDSALYNQGESVAYFNTALGSKAMFSNTTGYANTATGTKALYANKTGNENTANGYLALTANTGSYNTAFGHWALTSNTTGASNTGNGDYALQKNTTGSNNTATGNNALKSNTTSSYNTATGSYSMYLNTTGTYNTSNGYRALNSNTTGSYNTADGGRTLYMNTTGSNNTGVGYYNLYNNTTGYSNVAIGVKALYSNDDRHNLVAVGDSALYKNGTGATVTYEASGNTAIGSKTLYQNSTGYQNTATGTKALYYNIDGYSNTANGFEALKNNRYGLANTAIGDNALFDNYEGTENTAVGYSALSHNSSGLFNTALGTYAGPVESFDNTTALGSRTDITASNQVRIGSDQVTSIGGYVGWSNISDGRVKKNMKDNVPGLAFINKLKPLTYNLDLDAADKIKQKPAKTNTDGKSTVTDARQLTARNEKEQIVYTGFVAQDVEKAAKEINYDFSGVDAAKNDKDLYGLRYAEFVVPLVKAVQELSQKNDEKDSRINELQKQIDELKTMFNNNQQQRITPQKAAINEQSSAQSVELNSMFRLDQNFPNPFKNSTTINCYLPVNNGKAFLNFYNQSGVLLKSVKIAGTGKNTINLKENELAAGTYMYALIVDEKMLDSKKMILVR